MTDPVALLILALYAFFVSFLQERFGAFQNLPANIKQLINAVLAFIVPAVVQLVAPIWQPEFGDAPEVVKAILLMVAPVVVWLISQAAHAIDRKLIA